MAETVEMSDTSTSKAAEVLNDVYDGRVFAGGWGEVETFKGILRTISSSLSGGYGNALPNVNNDSKY